MPRTNTCLNCGLEFGAVGTPDGSAARPLKEGDITVCMNCAAVMMLDSDLNVRGMTDSEIEDLLCDRAAMTELARMVRAVHFMRHEQN